jgi:hypothetical protein
VDRSAQYKILAWPTLTPACALINRFSSKKRDQAFMAFVADSTLMT